MYRNTVSRKAVEVELGLPVVVSADSPHTDAADWLRVEQAAIVRVDQGQHAILEH